MRLSVAVNGLARLTASLAGVGYMKAILNMRNLRNDQDFGARLQVDAIDTSQAAENVRLNWQTIRLSVGDVVELRILEDGIGDPPTEQKKASEMPTNLLTQSALAKEVIDAVADCDKRLWELAVKAEQSEPPDEYEKFSRVVRRLIYEHGALLYPIFRRHKELIPDELRGEGELL